MEESVECPHCTKTCLNTALLGRKVRRRNRTTNSNSSLDSSELEDEKTGQQSPNDDVDWDEALHLGVGDAFFAFHKAFEDARSQPFADEPVLNPEVQEFCASARGIIPVACMNMCTLGESRKHFMLVTTIADGDDECACQKAFSGTFSSAQSFSNYLQRARRLLARGKGGVKHTSSQHLV
eukprot:IDg5190t1